MLEKELGRGGMGLVFLGRDARLDRPVAIKAILPGDNDRYAQGPATEKQSQDRFLQEAKIGANLTHPAIATVHDFGFHGDTPFAVFEYVAGPMLYHVLKRRGRLPLDEVQLIIGPLSQALDFAHSRFVVHRDLKPANIKATEQGDFKILDLGLAREFRRPADWRGFEGTPAYASPEQAEGLPCDGRTDQYALALIAYELLSGRRPFQSRDPRELLQSHRAEEPPPLSSLAPDVPKSVEAAIRQALSKDPDRRFPSCEQFALAIGCRLLSRQAVAPDILLEAEAKISTGRSIFSRAKRACVALTADRLWISENEGIEITNWPVADIESFQPRGRRSVVLGSRPEGRSSERVLTFHRASQRDHWYSTLKSFESSQANPVAIETRPTGCRIVPLKDHPASLRRRTQERYQVLGPVEALGRDWTSARQAMTIRAAILGADAVADLREETVPGLNESRCRSSGVCLQTVDLAGRQALGMRWFEQEVRAGTTKILRMAVAILPILLIICLCECNNPMAVALYGILLSFTVMLPVVLLRRLYWPQLVQPTVIACSILFITVFGSILLWQLTSPATPPADIASRGVKGPRGLINPIQLFLLYALASILLATKRISWASRMFRSLFKHPGRPAWRRIAAISLLYPLFGCYLTYVAISVVANGEEHLAYLANEAILRTTIWIKPDDAEAHYWLGATLAGLGKPDEAIAEYREAIRHKPHCPDAHYWLGHALRAQGKHGEALDAFRAATRLKPDDGEWHYWLGATLADQEMWEEAIAEYREAIRLKFDGAEVHYWLGAALGSQKKLEEAIAEYREAVRLKFDGAEVHYWLGAALARQKKLEQAIAEYRVAIRLKPDLADAHYWLGHALRAQAKHGEALDAFRAATRLNPNDGEWRYWLGVTSAHQEMWDEAIAEYREAIRLKFDGGEVHYWLGVTSAHQEMWEEAVAEYREAIRLKFDGAEVHYWLGAALGSQKKLEEAIAEYRVAIRIKPDLADAHYWLGHALRDRGKHGEALEAFRAATRLKPDDGEWRYWLGVTLAHQEMWEEAIAEYREAIRLKFDGGEVHYWLGAAVRSQKKLEEAIAEYREAIRLKFDGGEVHYRLGAALARQNKLEQAIAEYRVAIRLKPDLADAHYWLGHALRDRGKHGEALEAFRAATRLKPDDGEWRYWLGVTLAHQEMWEEAIAEYREAIRLKFDGGEVHYSLGAALARQKKLEQAIAEYRVAIRLKPDLADAHYWLGHALRAQGKHGDALEAFRTATRLKPDDGEWRYWLGATLAHQEMWEEAVAEYREAIRLKPDDATAHNSLGVALAGQGNREEAIAEYRKAIGLEPGLALAHGNLGQALRKQGKLEEAIAEYREGIRLELDDARARNNLAWALVVSPKRPRRDYDEGLLQARKAVELAPKDGHSFNTLALAEYRSGHWAESLAAGERSMELRKGGDAYDWFLLAMARWQKGDKDEARKWFDKAVAWTREKDPKNAELRQFWREAAERVGQPGPNAPGAESPVATAPIP